MCYNGCMNKFVYNPTKAPRYYGQRTVIPAENYGVVPRDMQLSSAVQEEGQPGFRPLFVANIPDRTPNLIP